MGYSGGNRMTALKGGSETVLLADDETSIRIFTKKVLEKFGYKVIDAFDVIKNSL